MTKIDKFKEYFHDYTDKYVIIGGTACDLMMEEAGLDFRSTKDIDIVLIIETLDKTFVKTFWNFIKDAGYNQVSTNPGTARFYRFSKPLDNSFPSMIEILSKKQFDLSKEGIIGPIHIDDEIYSLSAILLDNEYYDFMLKGTKIVDGLRIIDEKHIIPFKIKAYLDLREKREAGLNIKSNDIKKHKNDVFRISQLLSIDQKVDTNNNIRNDIETFIEMMVDQDIDLKALGIINITKQIILDTLKAVYL